MQDTRGQAGWDRRCDRHHVTGRSYPACPMCSQLVTRDTRACVSKPGICPSIVSKPGICPSIGIYTHPSASITTCLQHTATYPSIAIYHHMPATHCNIPIDRHLSPSITTSNSHRHDMPCNSSASIGASHGWVGGSSCERSYL